MVKAAGVVAQMQIVLLEILTIRVLAMSRTLAIKVSSMHFLKLLQVIGHNEKITHIY